MVLQSMISSDFLFSLFSPCSRARKQRRSGVGPPRKVAVNQSGFLRKGVLPMKENAIRQIVKKSFWRIRIQLTGKGIFYMVSKVMAVSDTESASQYRRWNSAMVNPTIKLKTPKRTEFGSKPVHAKITYFDIVRRVATKDDAEAFQNKCSTPER